MENLYSYMNMGEYFVVLLDNEYGIIFINVQCSLEKYYSLYKNNSDEIKCFNVFRQ